MLAVLGHIGDPRPDRVDRFTDRERRAAHRHMALGRTADTKETLHDFRAAGTDKSVKAQNLAAPQREGHIGEFGGVGEALDREHDFARYDGAFGKHLINGAADHQPDEIRLGDVGGQPLADLLAVAQADPAVGQAENLVEFMRNEQDCMTFRLQLRDEAK